MAENWSTAAANAALDALLAAYPWIKLHTGAPGSAGTSNAAAETTRKQATWTSAAAGAASNSGALAWTSVAGSETYTKFSAWSASSAGSFGFSGSVTASAIVSGNDFTIAIGDLDVSIPTAT